MGQEASFPDIQMRSNIIPGQLVATNARATRRRYCRGFCADKLYWRSRCTIETTCARCMITLLSLRFIHGELKNEKIEITPRRLKNHNDRN